MHQLPARKLTNLELANRLYDLWLWAQTTDAVLPMDADCLREASLRLAQGPDAGQQKVE